MWFLKAITFGPTYTLLLLINNIQLTTQVWCRRADWECGQPWCDLEPGCWTNPRTNYKWVVRWEEVTAFHSPGRETIRMWLFHTVGLRSSRCQTSAWRFRPTSSQVTSSVQEAFLKTQFWLHISLLVMSTFSAESVILALGDEPSHPEVCELDIPVRVNKTVSAR